MLFAKVQRRLDVALPRISNLIDDLGSHPKAERVGDAPLRAIAHALHLTRRLLSREPGTVASALYYPDNTTIADALIVLRHARASLQDYARRYMDKARW